MDGGDGLFGNRLVRFGAAVTDRTLDVGPRLLGRHRMQVTASGDPLRQRLHAWRRKRVVELWTAAQDHGHARLISPHDVGRHPHRLEHLDRQGLSLINDQQQPSLCRFLRPQSFDQRQVQLTFDDLVSIDTDLMQQLAVESRGRLNRQIS